MNKAAYSINYYQNQNFQSHKTHAVSKHISYSPTPTSINKNSVTIHPTSSLNGVSYTDQTTICMSDLEGNVTKISKDELDQLLLLLEIIKQCDEDDLVLGHIKKEMNMRLSFKKLGG
jgi:hypothetical protein